MYVRAHNFDCIYVMSHRPQSESDVTGDVSGAAVRTQAPWAAVGGGEGRRKQCGSHGKAAEPILHSLMLASTPPISNTRRYPVTPIETTAEATAAAAVTTTIEDGNGPSPSHRHTASVAEAGTAVTRPIRQVAHTAAAAAAAAASVGRL